MRLSEKYRIPIRTSCIRQMILALLAPFIALRFRKGWNERNQCSGGNDFCADIAWVLCNLADTADTFI